MSIYADTTFLASLYLQDVHSPKAVARMKSYPVVLPICWLHRVELRNAIQLRVFWKTAAASDANAWLSLFEQDLRSGVYMAQAVDLLSVTAGAERISDQHTPQIGARSLDILHVANALHTGASEFLTFDNRQATLAQATGLTVPAL